MFHRLSILTSFLKCSTAHSKQYKRSSVNRKISGMILQCQRDSYLQEFTGKVLSCNSGELKTKEGLICGYEIILDDTILFPEGGGQPEDYGTINGIPVVKVMKCNGKTIHFIKQPLSPEDNANVVVDWKRRFDHMQQHSAQHLITAIAENRFSAPTTSWNLGAEVSSIELNTPSFNETQKEELENILNDQIRLGVPLNVDYYDRGDPKLKEVSTRLELPDDHTGQIRVVSIEGIDRNTCCGTHVKNLGHLQCIKLLYTERGKKNKTNLFFVAGNRVFKCLNNFVAREQQLTGVLKGNPSEHVNLADKLQKSLKLSQKNLLSMSRDLALLEGKHFKQIVPRPKYYSFHKREGDLEFMTLFVNEVDDKEIVFFLTTGDEKGAGQLLFCGNPELIDQLSPKMSKILEAKGFAKNGRFQAKVNNFAKRSQVEDLIKQNIM